MFGVSLLLEGVKASLKIFKDLEIMVVDPLEENSIKIIQALHPAVVIFDQNSVQAEFHLSLFQQPDLLLVSIDAETSKALVWSSRRETVMDSADLIQVILSQSS